MRDASCLGRYVHERIVPLGPAEEPLPFRGRLGLETDLLPFADDMDAALLGRDGAVWNVTGPSGAGKTLLARWAASRWGRRFLERPDDSPVVLWVDAAKLREALQDDRALTGGPFAFALAAEVPGETPEAVARLLTRHPVIAVIDKDEDPQLAAWKLELPIGLPPRFRVLHLALRDSLGGASAHLELWDRETALLFAHRRRGADGVSLVDALLASPFGALGKLPPFVAWLLGPARPPLEDVKSGACVAAYLAQLHDAESWCGYSYPVDCAELVAQSADAAISSAASRRFHLAGPPAAADDDVGRVFQATLLAQAIQGPAAERVLAKRIIPPEELALVARLPWSEAQKAALRSSTAPCFRSSHLTSAWLNAINLRWWVARDEVEIPPGGACTGLVLPGYRFLLAPHKVTIAKSDLSGISFGVPMIRELHLAKCSLRSAAFGGASLVSCQFRAVDLELADLTGCAFERCEFHDLSLAEAMLAGATFIGCAFRNVTFGFTGEDAPLRLQGSKLSACDLGRAAPAGLCLNRCEVKDTSFAGLALSSLEAERAIFEECDMIGLAARGAHLHQATFRKCLLADANLSGADLRQAAFEEVEFQPGPSSRAGMTDELSRPDALYGSKSGFYAQDLAEGVYADPELTRTADLRGSDLRGAAFRRTDLFRVDLRGAQLDPKVEEQARRMRAFVDE